MSERRYLAPLPLGGEDGPPWSKGLLSRALAATGLGTTRAYDLARRVDIPVIASGGVKGLDDIRMLALHSGDGIEGVITGRAIYEGKLDLATAIAMAGRV